MIDVTIDGIGLITMQGLPESWRFIHEGPLREGLYMLAVTCPKEDNWGWLKAATEQHEPMRVQTPAHTVIGRLCGLDLVIDGSQYFRGEPDELHLLMEVESLAYTTGALP
jgi:hypothetical protein